MTTYQREFLSHFDNQLIRELEPLLIKHYLEISHYLDIPLKPNWNIYLEAEKLGKLHVYTARKDAGLIGYAAFLVDTNPHYMDSLQAMQDVIYLDPNYRGGRTGLMLIKYAENELRTCGVQVVYHHVKLKHPQLGRLLEALGYEQTDQLYARRLDNGS